MTARTKIKSRYCLENRKGQTLPVVLILCSILSLFAVTLLFLFSNQAKFQVKYMDSMDRQEIANIALQHAMVELQQGTNWNSLPLTGFQYDQEYTTNKGTYKLNILAGNLFINSQTVTTGWGWHRTTVTTDQRQGQINYRTIGIKIKSKQSGVTHQYYAVLKQGFGGPLISKGLINLPCISNYSTAHDSLDFYWGDVYSANTNDGACKIPFIQVARGTDNPPAWMPHVYAAGNIYTALNPEQPSPGPYTFGYVADDMTPTAHCHPYSPVAYQAGQCQVDLDYYKSLASKQNNYFGPQYIGGGVSGTPNPYYNQGNDLSIFSPAQNAANSNVYSQIVAPMASADTEAVVFIDTTDALPEMANGANTYCYTTVVPKTQATPCASPQAISLYADDGNQYYTKGSLFVMGPLIFIGDDPDWLNGSGNCNGWWNNCNGCPSSCTRVSIPSNYYYPQNCTNGNYGSHLNCNNTWGWRWGQNSRTYYTICNLKHEGFLYVNGELRIGGPRIQANNGAPATSDICIYGTIFIDQYGELTEDTTLDTPALWVYFNSDMNMFSSVGNNVMLVSFGEMTFLVPTPGPY